MANGLSSKCGGSRCTICKYVKIKTKVGDHPLLTRQNCNSAHGIYLLTCTKCGKKYVGETGNKFRKRLMYHILDIKHKKATPVGTHFGLGECSLLTLDITFLETLKTTDKQYKNKSMRLDRERFWTQKLQTFEPVGLNKIPLPLEKPLMPFVIPFSESSIQIAKVARDTFDQIKATFPTKFPHTFVTAFSKNKNIKDILVRSKFGNATLVPNNPWQVQEANHQPPTEQRPMQILIAIPRVMLSTTKINLM